MYLVWKVSYQMKVFVQQQLRAWNGVFFLVWLTVYPCVCALLARPHNKCLCHITVALKKIFVIKFTLLTDTRVDKYL